jgi:nucleoside-diphosphate-sugar epimerase
MAATVIVTGATSQLGVFLLPRLAASGFRIIALSRKAPTEPLARGGNVFWLHPDADLASGLERARRAGADGEIFLVSCGPLAMALRLLDEHPGIERIVAFSTSSLLTKGDSEVQEEKTALRDISDAEDRLRSSCSAAAVPLLLLRPTLIYGCGLDRNISLLARFGSRFGFIPVAGAAGGLRQPVHADDLAALAAAALLASPAFSGQGEAGGGSTLSYREMVQRTAAACSGRVRLVSLPAGLFAALVRLGALFSVKLNAGMVRRQAVDMVFDDRWLRQGLNYQPRPFDPSASDFEMPVEAARLQLQADG